MLPMTSTQDTFSIIKIASREEKKLPFMHPVLVTDKTGAQHAYPFSFHDNRHSVKGAGEYFINGYGRKKISSARRQHSSQNFNFYCHEPPPKATNDWEGFTNYQLSHTWLQGPQQTFFRRFPRNHLEQCTTPVSKQNSSRAHYTNDAVHVNILNSRLIPK
ncbi:hypothetical protein GDO86_013424 [Hymenochirus boettgeri]|nr:hypothetical protein GDO86_013424 [Hymenochirus boettgeri]